MSLPLTTMFVATSSGVVTDWLFAVGVSFTGVTVIATVPVASRLPSLTVNVKLSGPL